MSKRSKFILVVSLVIFVISIWGLDVWLLSQIVPINTIICGAGGHEVRVTYPRSLDAVCNDLDTNGAYTVFEAEDTSNDVRVRVVYGGMIAGEGSGDITISQKFDDLEANCRFSAFVFMLTDDKYRIDVDVAKNATEQCSVIEHPEYTSNLNHKVILGVSYQNFVVEILSVIN